MRHVCAWCLAEIRRIPAPRYDEDAASHGICGSCLRDLERRKGTELLALIEALPHAALAVDGDLRIRAANQRACNLFQDEWTSLQGQRLGERFGCWHGWKPGGISGDPICPGCEVHRLVQHTLETGMGGFTALPSIPVDDIHPPITGSHQISSLRVGDMVALRFDVLNGVPNNVGCPGPFGG